MNEETYKFHCTYGETKKLISCAIGDLNRSIETKFSVVAPFLVKMYLAEVEDYIEWDSDTESVVTAEPNTKIWKITVEKKEPEPKTEKAEETPCYGADGDASSEQSESRLPQNKLYVGNLDRDCTKKDLQSLFEVFGTVVECDVIRDYGFVHFADDKSALKAVKDLNQSTFRNKTIKVKVSRSAVRHKPGMDKSTCFKCGQTGHWTKNCPDNKEYLARCRGQGRFRGGRGYYDPYYGAPGGRGGRYRSYEDPYRRPPLDPYTDPYYARDFVGHDRDVWHTDPLPSSQWDFLGRRFDQGRADSGRGMFGRASPGGNLDA